MKKIIYTFSIFCLGTAVYAQNANIVFSGANVRMVANGTPEIVLNNTNIVNNGSGLAFIPNSSTVRFTGTSGDASIGGSSSSSFYNMRVNKTGFEVDLLSNITVTNQLELINGNVNFGNQSIGLITTGSIIGEGYPNGNRVYCADNQTGRIQIVYNLVSGANTNIAGLGLDITVTGAAPGFTTINRGHDRQTSSAFLGAGTSIGRYYDFTPSVSTGYTYTFLFRYHDQELGGMPETDFVFYRSPSYGTNTADWQEWGEGNGPLSPGYPSAGLATHNPSANTVSLSGINSFSRWTVSNSVVNPLPIELISFTADCADESVILNWKTATEINNNKFTIHRSANLQYWEEVITVPGAGNSNQELSYTAVDERPLDGLAYYRLTQTDYDGTSESFDPISIFCQGGKEQGRMSVYPNPATDVFTVSIYSSVDVADGNLSFTDVNGKSLMNKQVSLVAGTNTFVFDRWSMNPGTYFIQLTSTLDGIKPVKLIVQ